MKRVPLEDVELDENVAVVSSIKKKNDPNRWKAFSSDEWEEQNWEVESIWPTLEEAHRELEKLVEEGTDRDLAVVYESQSNKIPYFDGVYTK